jgi:hypothetical protein
MPKKIKLAALNGLLEAINKPPANQNLSELTRIAEALERIATALEKLTETQSYEDKNSWITLPDFEPVTVNSSPVHLNGTASVEVVPPQPVAAKAVSGVPPAEKETVLLKYLKERGITIEETKTKPDPQTEAKFDKIALHLGQNFAACEELYKLLKRNMVAPRSAFNYSLKGATQGQNQVVREFCRLLKDAGLLESMTYQGTPEYNLNLKASGKEQKYLSGSWLEYYVKQEVERLAQLYSGQPYTGLPNLKVVFKTGVKAELDLLFALGQTVFCVEAKLRPTLADLKAHVEKIRPLQLKHKQILIIVVDKTDEQCVELTSALGNVQIVRLANFEAHLSSLLRNYSPVKA